MVVGMTGGAETVTLTARQSGLRDHKHSNGSTTDTTNIIPSGGANYPGAYTSDTGAVKAVDGNVALTGAQGALDPHSNMMPYVVLPKIIKY